MPSGAWGVLEEIWVDGKRTQKTVPKAVYLALGLDPTLSITDARKRIKQINAEKKLDSYRAVEAARRVAKIGFYEDTFFPQEIVDAFTEKVRIDTAGSDAHLLRLYSHFKFIQEMIMTLKLLPKEYADQAGYFYKYMIDKRISVDYSKKLIQMLNMWGRFISKKQVSFFEEVPMPPRKMRVAIAKAQRGKSGVRTESERLTLEMLKTLCSKLPEAQGNWLHCSFWLGLRPIEVDQLAALKNLEIMIGKGSGVKILAVDQTKIQGEESKESYKYIPILYPEQEVAIKLLAAKNLKRPTVEKLREISGLTIDLYCGRKSFVDLMQNLGQRPEDASIWMGHKDIKTTLAHYKDRANVPFTPVAKRKA